LGIDRVPVHGALLVDKPSGPTSHDIVAFARRTLKTPGIGHTGTLDPLATGLLVLLVGHATRLSQFLVTDEKEYLADVRLGVATPSYDAASLSDGVRRPITDDRWPTDAELEAVLAGFRGSFLQMPPPFSAKKIAGIRAYEKARKNQPVDLKPASVTVRELQVLDTSTVGHRTSGIEHGGLVRLRVAASSGFYVRSLAHDIGQLLGCGAHLEALRRTAAGRFRLTDALTLDAIEAAGPAIEARLIGLNTLLADMPALTLTDEGMRRAGNGNTLAPAHLAAPLGAGSEEGKVRLLEPSGRLLSVAERRPDGLLHPLLVLR
jgi:tRNA pseudouridine55 synthase